MNLELINQSDKRLPRQFLAWWAGALSKKLLPRHDVRKLEVTVVYMNATEARALNLRFRKKDYATDVLSFAPSMPGSLGELVICPEVVKAQAVTHELPEWAELGYLFTHGVLHLLGYEHEDAPLKARRMFRLQDELFESLYALYLRKKKSKN